MRRAGTGLLFIGVLMSGCAGHPANPLSFLLTSWSFMPNRDKPLRRLWIAFRPPEEWWFWELEVGPADISRGLSCRNRTSRFADWACQANSDFTAMAGGTIVLGPLAASSGADYFTVQDLGVDAG